MKTTTTTNDTAHALWLELHILQNFSPSNLNRDDTGAPKDAVFGGFRRARISSQCQKRGVRTDFDEHGFLVADTLSVRTKLVAGEVAKILAKDHNPEESLNVACRSIESVGLKLDSKNKKTDQTMCLVFLPARHLRTIAGVCHEHWKEVVGAKAASEVPKAVTERIAKIIMDASRAPEIALFGRMIAEGKGWNMEASAQVAHSISTHAIETECDFFTALDDLAPKGDHASAHMDTAQFVSACYYRYSALSVPLLASNLGDESLVEPTIRAMIEASVRARPTGKQAGSAAHNPASYVLAVVHGGQPYSLANAFVRPIHVGGGGGGGDLIGESIRALDGYFKSVNVMHGKRHGQNAIACADRDATRDAIEGLTWVPSVNELLNGVLGLIAAARKGEQ